MEPIGNLFAGLRWQDIVDIALNSYILFRLYVIFRGTNVIRVLVAIGFLWIIKQVAALLGLIITSWAIQGVITVAALIIIVVFRNEIRSVLQTKDLKSFFWGIPRHQHNTPLSIIVESVYELARKKTGALIVLPLKQGTEGVVQGGIPWKGKLSREMLISIFWKDNPVHDGAALVKGEEITDVGTILPLSNREDIPSHFGTRHRAALGLAEKTDALVIVVSEELGKITLIKENRIYDINDPLVFEKLLQEHTGEDSSSSGLKHQTMELVTAGILCFFLVTGLAINFSKGMETLVTHEVPLEFMIPDKKMEIFSSSASSVKLLLSGARPLVNSISQDQVKVMMNLSRAVPGDNRLAVTRDNIVLPPGIQVKQIEPASIDINVDVPAAKELPVQPYWTGKLPDGLILEYETVVPDMVRVVSGSLLLKNISTIFTNPIPLNSITESGSITVDLDLDSAIVKIEDNRKNNVRIDYTISKKIESDH